MSEVGGVGDDRNLGVLMECKRLAEELNEESAMSSSESTRATRLLGFLMCVISGDADGDARKGGCGSCGSGWEEPARVVSDPPNRSSLEGFASWVDDDPSLCSGEFSSVSSTP